METENVGSNPIWGTNHLPRWWNGRHAGLRSQCPKGCAGSSPALGTMKNIEYTSYTLLPSGNVFKVNSILPLQNLDKHLNESTNLIMFVVHNIKCNDKEVMIYNRDLFRLTYGSKECKEMIMKMNHSHILE